MFFLIANFNILNMKYTVPAFGVKKRDTLHLDQQRNQLI